MKKTLILGILIASLIGVFTINTVNAAVYTQEESKQIIKEAIAKYKEKNYLSCISDLKLYTDKDPDNAVAQYYLGSAYMNVAMKDDARVAFDKVIELNTVPQLTSYAVQAKLCMENPIRCSYKNFNYEEIQKLRENPENFFNEIVNAVKLPEIKDANVEEIDKLIDGAYSGVHPDAKAFIDQERVKIQQSKMNASRVNSAKTANPTSTAPANNVRTRK